MTAARRGLVLLLVAAGGAGGVMAARASRAPAAPPVARHEVYIRALQFQPAVVTAAPGDSVVWTNSDLFPHTVTDPGGAWDSGSLAPGESWVLVVPPRGDADYLCVFHPTMTGTITLR